MRNSDISQKQAYSVTQFCAAHSISRAMFYVLRKQGKGPRTMKVGRRTLISKEAAREWRARIEQESGVNKGIVGFIETTS